MQRNGGICLFAIFIFLAFLPSTRANLEANPIGRQQAHKFKTATIEEKFLLEHSPNWKRYGVSSDGSQIVWLQKDNKKDVVVVNSEPGPAFDAIATMADNEGRHFIWDMSPDEKHLAYAGRQGKTWMLILDGKEYANLGEGVPGDLRFSADSQHVAWLVPNPKTKNSILLFVDGKERATISSGQGGTMLTLSPDGQRWAYWAGRGALKKPKMVVDGTEFEHFGTKEGPYGELSRPIFSPDGQHLAYYAVINNQVCMVVDGNVRQEGGRIGYFGIPVFSPDSIRLAYVFGKAKALSSKIQGVVVDEQLGPLYERIMDGPVFSPDSQHIAYVAVKMEGVTEYIIQVIDGQVTFPTQDGKLKPTECSELIFSPDGNRLAYVLREKDNSLLVLDGKQYGPKQENIGSLVFSPTGRFLAYSIRRGKKWSLVVNQSEGKGYDDLWWNTYEFTTDEKQFKYIAEEGNKLYLVTQAVE